ncbi:zinc dependent phospholipase C family protein [Flavobacterium sp. K5-23]|uniref:zinc dependent phospholipase C family protein n=1 Tax=Flavobacterium sp. K5-23 TaxID=2746225 RepID=UPI00200D8D60|nr:zinc dependent phospholipase C family protein [Flavobacterium sp. K5-23]UQD56974.1 zinc dependent phospholipase C family protein [Flavobacterium sp. K5-23]
MKNNKLKRTVILFSAIAIGFLTLSWGIVGHERINRAAVMALPAPLQVFFYNHIDFITQESTVPDLRKFVLQDKAEGPRHYFDMENFGAVDSFPKTMTEAKKKYDDKFLSKNGILPWYIQDMMVKLTQAFKDKRKSEILFLAGDLGHYIADAHMPLHTSDNHDGQNTDQKGIHSLWESRLPDLFVKQYKLNAPQAQYYADVDKATWDMIKDTHSLVEPLLAADKGLRTSLPKNQVFVTDENGTILKNKFNGVRYTDEYAGKFHKALDGMVESQMRKAITVTASFWYTAWVNAGKPDLSNLDSQELTKRNSRFLKKDLKTFNKGKLFGIESDKDAD